MLQFSHMRKRGFTIIELLMVIVLIGILSVLVLAIIRSAKDDATEVSAKAQLSQIRSQAALFHERHGNTYNSGSIIDHSDSSGTTCVSAGGGTTSILHTNDDHHIVDLINGIKLALGPVLSNDVHCYVGANVYSVSALINTDGDAFCVDSSNEPRKDAVAEASGCVDLP